MSEALARFLKHQNVGRLRQSVPLGGRLALDAGAEVEAWLCRTRRGAFLAGVDDEGHGRLVDLLESPLLSYEMGRVADRLKVGDESFSVSTARRRAARVALALARLTREGRGPLRPPRSVTVHAPSTVQAAWMAAWLDDDEEVLFFWPTEREVEVRSPLGPVEEVAEHLLVTDRRAVRCAVGELGDAVVEPLGPSSVPAKRSRRSARALGRIPTEVLEAGYGLQGEGAPARRLEVARLNWRHRKEEAVYRARAAMMVRRLLDDEDPYGVFTAFFLRTGLGLTRTLTPADLNRALERLIEQERDSSRLASWWQGFGLEVEAGMLLVERARALKAGSGWSLALHAALREEASKTSDVVVHGQVELDWAEHLHDAGRDEEAAEVARAALARLPPPEVDDFMPPEGLRAQEVRVRALRLLADADAAERPKVLVKLLQRRPLDLEVAVRLSEEGEGWGKEAAETVAELLRPGGLLRAEAPAALDASPRALDVEHIDLLEHPATRGSQAMGAFQAYLAVATEPDRTSLRAYCERLNSTLLPDAAAAVSDAVVMLGAPTVDAFISRGEKGVGVRGYEGKPAFLLIGGHHLDPENEFFLARDELRFAIAAEVAHIRFKHKRMTPQEVWTGAWEKSRAGLDLVFTLLPAFKGWDLAEKLMKAVTLTRTAVGKVDKAAKQAIREESLGLRVADLVEAHRLMQLTADRAGLTLSRDLRSALRAIFLLDPTLRAELPLIERHGLAHALLRKDDDGELYFPDVLIRVSALIGFYASGAFRRLEDAVWGSTRP